LELPERDRARKLIFGLQVNADKANNNHRYDVTQQIFLFFIMSLRQHKHKTIIYSK